MGIKAKQIDALFEARVGISGFTSTGGNSDDITQALTTVLSTAGRGGISVPLQVGNDTVPGVQTANGYNLAPIFGADGTRLRDANNDDVYAKIALANSKWSATYFVAPGGVEAAFSVPANTVISLEPVYIFTFATLPRAFATSVTDRHVAPDPSTIGMRTYEEALSVTGTNTLSALSFAQAGPLCALLVNGVEYVAPKIGVNGKVITWNAAPAGFALTTDDDVSAIYSY